MTSEELSLALSEGEGYRIEFKEQIANLDREMVAFANLMQRIDYIEKMGTGIRRMQNLLKEAGLPPLRYDFSGFVRAIFPRPQQATQQVDAEKMGKILAYCLEPKSRDEIMRHLGLKDREHFRSEILLPLIESGQLELTIPDKPKSPKQKYMTRATKEHGTPQKEAT